MKKTLYRMNASFGRQGDLEGVFIAYPEYVELLIEDGYVVYFGEVLGKHSEIYGAISKDEIELLTDDEFAIAIVERYKLESGYNPFVYSVFGSGDDKNIHEIITEKLNLKE